MRTRPDTTSFASSAGAPPPPSSVAGLLAHGVAFRLPRGGADSARVAPPQRSHRATISERSVESAGDPPLGSFTVLGYSLFALQQPAPLTLRTLAEAMAAPRSPRDHEFRGSRPRVDPFTLLGEIGFLDI